MKWPVLVFVFLVACSQTSSVAFVEFDNGARFFVDIASNHLEQQKGLMFVESLPKDKGMLFVFDEAMPRTFWMKNTLIPLDMVFIDENGVVLEVKENVLPCESDPCPTYPSEFSSKFVLELNAGVANQSNIVVGRIMKMKQ